MPLSPELLAEIKAAISSGQLDVSQLDARGRSALRPRQLHNLNLKPTKDDPRPDFHWSAEAPRDGSGWQTSEFPKLMWHGQTGTEITVLSAEGQAEKMRFGYVLTCPATADPYDETKAMWDALSPEDQETLREAQRAEEMAALKKRMGDLSPDRLKTLLAEETKKRRAS